MGKVLSTEGVSSPDLQKTGLVWYALVSNPPTIDSKVRMMEQAKTSSLKHKCCLVEGRGQWNRRG